MAISIPVAWLPKCSMKRIIVHWTGGGPSPSSEDLEHYHLLIDRQGRLHRGDHSIVDNMSTKDDDYAAHCRLANTRAIGVAFCAMANAREKPFRPGPYPITRIQWNNGLLILAQLCRRYTLQPVPKELLMHCEVEKVLGIHQDKWDVSVLIFDRGQWASMTPGEEMRARVTLLLNQGK